jgi:hypothetical protein
MGDLVAFRREADPASPDSAASGGSVLRDSRDRPGGADPGFPRTTRPRRPGVGGPSASFRRLGATRSGSTLIRTSHPDSDPYLLVLLADQELTAGRDEQACCLLDAAYAAFDRQTDGEFGSTTS